MAQTNARTRNATPDTAEGRKVPQVLAAAKQVFMEQGFEAASMDAIARLANVSKATLYAYYPSKAQLFAAIVAEACEKQREAFEAVVAEDLPVEQALYKIGLHFVRFILKPDVLQAHRVVIGEAARFPELGRAFFDSGPKATHLRLAAILRGHEARGELAVPDPELAAELFLSMVKGLFQLRGSMAVGPKVTQAEIERVVREAVRIFVKGYRPDTAQSRAN